MSYVFFYPVIWVRILFLGCFFLAVERRGRRKRTGLHCWNETSQWPHSPRVMRGFGVMGLAESVVAMASMVVRERRRVVVCMIMASRKRLNDY